MRGEIEGPVPTARVRPELHNHAKLKIAAALGSSCGADGDLDKIQYPSRFQIGGTRSRMRDQPFASGRSVSTGNAQTDHVFRYHSAPLPAKALDPSSRESAER